MESELILLRKTLALMEARITELENEVDIKIGNFIDQGKIIDLFSKKNVLILYDKYQCLYGYTNVAEDTLSFLDAGVNLMPLMNLYLYLYNYVNDFDNFAHFRSHEDSNGNVFNEFVDIKDEETIGDGNDGIIKKYLYTNTASQMRTEIHNFTTKYKAFYYTYKECSGGDTCLCNVKELNNYELDLIYKYPDVNGNFINFKSKIKHIFKHQLDNGFSEFSYLGRSFAHIKFYLMKLVTILNKVFNPVGFNNECFSQKHYFTENQNIYHSIFHFNTKKNTYCTNNPRLKWGTPEKEINADASLERILYVAKYGDIKSLPTKMVSNLAFRISDDGENNGLFFTEQMFDEGSFSKTKYNDSKTNILDNSGLFYHSVIDTHSVDEKISTITEDKSTIKFYNIYKDEGYKFKESNNESVYVKNGGQLFIIVINEMLHYLHRLEIGIKEDGHGVPRLIDFIIVNSIINLFKKRNPDINIKNYVSITFNLYVKNDTYPTYINDCFGENGTLDYSYYYKSVTISYIDENEAVKKTEILFEDDLNSSDLMTILKKILAYILYYI